MGEGEEQKGWFRRTVDKATEKVLDHLISIVIVGGLAGAGGGGLLYKHSQSNQSAPEATSAVEPGLPLPVANSVLVPATQPVHHAPKVSSYDVKVPNFENNELVEFFPSSGTATGATRESAIGKAIEEAVSKQGALISADIRLKLLAETKKMGESGTGRVEQSVATDFARITDGVVRWWDIKMEEDSGDSFRVEVLAVIAKIKQQSADHATRKTLAVLPFRASAASQVLEKTVSAEKVGKMFRESALTYLVQSRKFAVVDNTFEEELDRMAATMPAMDPIQRALQAAVKLGAQYVVIGTLEGFAIKANAIDATTNVRVPSGYANLRVIEVKTRQTLVAAAYQMDELGATRLDGDSPETFLVDATGRAMAERILESIYPLKVAGLNGPDEVILNRGGEAVAVGDRMEIFNPGEELKDPSTGESLGVAERKAATAEVIRVLPKVSYAKILEKTEPVVVEAVCRKPQVSKESEERKANSAKKSFDELFK